MRKNFTPILLCIAGLQDTAKAQNSPHTQSIETEAVIQKPVSRCARFP